MANHPEQSEPVKLAAKVCGCYLALGILWIVATDQLLLRLVQDAEQLTRFQSYKGWLFVAVSSAVLFWLVITFLKKMRVEQDRSRMSDARLRELTEASPDAILVEVGQKIVYANAAAARMFGETADKLLHRGVRDFIAEEDRRFIAQHWSLPADEKLNAPVLEVRVKRPENTLLHVQLVCVDIEWQDQAALQVILRDVTELKSTQEKLKRISEHLQLAIEGAGECIWELDVPANKVRLRGGLVNVFDFHANVVEGSPRDWKHLMHPEDVGHVNAALRAALQGKAPSYEAEYRVRALDGSWRWVLARGVVVERDKLNNPLVMAGTMADVTARKESHDLAWRYANLDTLTSLPNRRLLSERLIAELRASNRTHESLAVLFIDLDGFKRVNDTYGHEAGDLLLLEVAARLPQCVRETDTVARLGGDEFAIVLTHLADIGHVQFICQKILEHVNEPFHIGKDIAFVSCSIGISLYPFDGQSPEELLRKADQAMYASKHGGKSQFHYFTKEMDRKAHQRLQLADALRQALISNEFTLQYQPIIHLSTGTVNKAEALLRWKHPVFGDIGPAEFIPMAEETGIIRHIGNWVFMEAAQFAKRCSSQTHDTFQISINKSPVQFMPRDADRDWLNYLRENDIPDGGISLEITEGVLLAATDGIGEILSGYRSAGVELTLDDFGTGYSSMAYLQKFKIDYVKIDQSFINNMTTDANCQTIVETIIVMAHKLGLKVIAEGIEKQEQYESLVALHCDFGQGFFFTPPLPPERLLHMVTANQSRMVH